MAAAGITGDAAKQMMAAVKGGGRKYFYFVSFGKKLCVLDIAFLLQAIISQFKEFLLVFRYVYVRSCLLPTLEPRLLEAFCITLEFCFCPNIFYRFYFCLASCQGSPLISVTPSLCYVCVRVASAVRRLLQGDQP